MAKTNFDYNKLDMIEMVEEFVAEYEKLSMRFPIGKERGHFLEKFQRILLRNK